MSYDYIVIGAGSAGCAVAARLSESGSASVLLLEAGPADTKQEIHIPAVFSRLFKSEVDWAYYTEPQAALHGRRIYCPRGKTLGGCSSINAMIYQRGNPGDYDHWAALGNRGWSYAELLPLFKRLENFEPGASAYHGAGGPLNVADLRDPNPLSRAFVQACQQVGLPLNDDHNGAEQEGFGLYRVNQKDGQRHSAAAAYLEPARSRPNLRVETDALATRLLFDNKRCTGVTYTQNGKAVEARVKRAVILSGGAINSPQLLLLSGIGDGQQLQALSIPVVHHLPGVGQNLIDHLIVLVAYACNAPLSLANAGTPESSAAYARSRMGLLTSNVGEAGGFVRVLPHSPVPDLQFHFAPSYFVNHGFDNPTGHGFSIGATLVQPKSVGYLRLRTRSPADHPIIQPNFLTHEDDMSILLEGVKLARTIAAAPALTRYREREYLPGDQAKSDDALRQAIRQHVHTLFHPVGTCKMGTDPLAVVNDCLEVHGIEGLRVADASVMPTIVNANTHIPCVVIGEKAADLILGRC
jgi:choline dehydrogenase